MEIAAEHSKAVGQHAWVGMKKWLFLDRITLHSAHVAPGNIQSAALVVADLAYSGLAFRNGATMSAGMTANPIVLEFLVQITLTNVPVNNVAKSGHGKPLPTF
jgi:hypothetical protein